MKSLWLDYKIANFDKINENKKCDVCIIGGGITGLSSAYYLSKNGLKIIVVEKDKLCSKVTGRTTAKITYQHGLIYDYLINSYDEKFAKAYLNANKDAISNIKEIIDEENIDCDFEYKSNVIYTTKQDEIVKINSEVKAINELGEEAEFITKSGLPFKIVGGVKVNNQAQFHPIKYCDGLVNSIEKYGGEIFENSNVSDIKKEDGGYVTFAGDFEIRSKYVVIASHYPLKNFPGFYFTKMYQSTSYVLAVDTKSDLFDDMYINSNEPVYSLKTANWNDKKILLLTGQDHKTGFAPTEEETYGKLEKFAKEHYPNYEILFKWNTRDCISLDKIPYIGEFSEFYPNVYVATGYNKWGMSSSNVAANIIKDKILGIENKYEFVFDSKRLHAIKNRDELLNMTEQVYKSWVENKINVPIEAVDDIKNENGGVIEQDGEYIGIYKDTDGKVYAVKPICTHLGCLLTWNNLDKTWDCPCHGSRFDYEGQNIYDPAFKNLVQIELE